MKRGLSGWLAGVSIRSPLTPLFLLAAVAFGVVGLLLIPREEEPQISVPMVDVHVRADGLAAPDAVELVTKPLEAIVKGIPGVEHVYSQTRDDVVTVTARFEVGTPADDAILRIHEKMRANYDRIPVGIPEPLIVGRGIDDVAIVVLTLSPRPDATERWTSADLTRVADEVRAELVKVDDVGLTYLAGGQTDEIRVEPDPERLAEFGVTLQQLIAKVRDANRSFEAGAVRDAGMRRVVTSGQTLSSVPDVGLLLLTTRDGRPVYVRDVASIVVGPAPDEQRAWTLDATGDSAASRVPAVSIAIGKRAGANAVVVAQDIVARVASLQGGVVIPSDLSVEITRNYGETASEKADELLFHLALATLSIVVLIAVVIGWREAVVTLVVIPTTILLTLFAAWLMGYTINRVSLFALIFAIGILVDDAIVVVENIARHWGMKDGRSRMEAAIAAVAEVGNPTVAATLAVVVALLPMLFVSGLMGPYMAPIPVNASAAMLFSFFVAVVVAPWLLLRLAPRQDAVARGHGEGGLGTFYRRVAGPVLATRARAWAFLLVVLAATVAVCLLFVTRDVTVKLLPFDNKAELSVVVDLPEGATLEDTDRVLFAAATIAGGLPQVTSVQGFAGTPAPFNFNGLVRHSYLRASPELGELQVNLLPKGDRDRPSHAIALELRQQLSALALPDGSSLKVVEVPPGPPVLATLLAEVYGPDAATRRAIVAELREIYAKVPFIVDVDDSIGAPAPRLRIGIDQDRLEFFAVEQRDVYDTVAALFGGVAVGYSHRGEGRDPIAITVRLPKSDLAWGERLAATPVPANLLPGDRTVVEIGDVVRVTREDGSPTIFRRNGKATDMVMAELAGAFEAPIYGMIEVQRRIATHDWGALKVPVVRLHGQPEDESRPTLLWDGEWEVTWVTFRDMGAAFAVAIIGIYVLMVAQFGSFLLPLVALTPVPLTLIGIVLGHRLFDAPFTATSMIGFIALAGIIVRNSILLIDFVRHGGGEGASLRDVLLTAGAIRFRPILLTALAAMIGAATILADPIFQGLAISLLFGLASSTLLTVLVIPAIWLVLRDGEAIVR
ncbi:MAG: efflux RND transporter permease subunit [Alphaproteobacteria bacterium]